MINASETALSIPAQSNSPSEIRVRLGQRRISWIGPLLLLPTRTVLWMTAQSLVALFFVIQNKPHPWRQACYWWSVCFTLADVVCIFAMRFLLRREGLRLGDLLGPIRLRYGHDLFLGIGYFLLFSPGFFIGGFLAQRIFYGPAGVSPSGFILHAHALPLWATVYSLTVFWIINSVVEEMTYQGYILPRLEALTGRTWIAFAAVAFWFTAQHCVLGFVPDVRSNLCRFFGFLPGVVIVIAIYVRTRRLAPIIVGHWIIDLSAVLMTVVY
jgi:membrane protease YdiL (CAAX protease family)